MSITLYPCVSVTVGSGSNSPSFGPTVPIMDAFTLYDQCMENGLETGWWFPKANSVSLVAGSDPSEAYLLVLNKYLIGCTAEQNGGIEVAALRKDLYRHRITLTDGVRADLASPNINTDGWVFHSSYAIDPSSDPEDLNSVHLVKFVDRRFLFNKTPAGVYVSGALLTREMVGYNIVSQTSNVDDITWDPDDAGEFPYDQNSLLVPLPAGSVRPYTWEELIEELWYHARESLNSVAELEDNGEYPERKPIDIRVGSLTYWQVLCNVIHASGNEIYPKLNGNFEIRPIDEDFLLDDEIFESWSDYLVDSRHETAEENRIPEFLCLTYNNRTRDVDSKNLNDYQTSTVLWPTSPSAPGSGDTLLEADEAIELDYSVASGEMAEDGQELIQGNIEDVLYFGSSWVDGETYVDNDPRWDMEFFVLRKLIRSRVMKGSDNTYGFFISTTPNSHNERITWFISEGGPATRTESLPSSIGVKYLEPIDQSGGGGDNLVLANTTPEANKDQTPNGLYEKTNNAGTYNDIDYALVYTEVVVDAGSPRDNKVRFFVNRSEVATGLEGSVGPPGPPGADGPTYTDGCGILVAGTVISLYAPDLSSDSIQADPETTSSCSIAVKAEGVAGCGLTYQTTGAGGDSQKLNIDPTSMLGKGLMAASDNGNIHGTGPCKIKVKPSDLAGCGLKVASDNADTAVGPTKLVIDLDKLIGTAGDETMGLGRVAGNQADDDGPCRIKVKTNITIKVPTAITLTFIGDVLRLTMDCNVYDVYGVAGTPTTLTADIATTNC